MMEILLAIVVISLGLGGVANMLDQSTRMVGLLGGKTNGLQLARMRSAEFQAAGFEQLAQAMGDQQVADVDGQDRKPFQLEGKPDMRYTWTAKLQREAASPNRIVFAVTVFKGQQETSVAQLRGFVYQ
ncbi:hypothetical protein ACFL34_05050 [Candidatus Sumerlaeota bacterium]